MVIQAKNKKSLLMINFKVLGDLRYLSHSETTTLLQRAMVRARMKLSYSQGFNPRIKMSLPLPRTVSVESEDELLCVWIEDDQANIDLELLNLKMSSQLPKGLEIISIKTSNDNKPPNPQSAEYDFTLEDFYRKNAEKTLKSRIADVFASQTLILKRNIKAGPETKDIDVRGFLESAELEEKTLKVKCRITNAGSIRVDEILKIFEIDIKNLAFPIKRTRVFWEN